MKKHFGRLLCLFFCLMLIALPVFAEEKDPAPIQLGEGQFSFAFAVCDLEGSTTLYTILTDCETVGAALLELELIAGEEGPYGLYVKDVQGIHLDYATDGHYWAFYENDEYALAGVDMTPITEGSSYAFHAE